MFNMKGTEIKAITYHAIKVKSPSLENPLAEVQFLVDI
jgi:SHS2 domain-containing protein